MGDAIDVVVEGRLVKLCCNGCVKKVHAEPAAAIAKVDRAVIEAQAASYPLETCLFQPGEALGDAPVDVVVGTRLARTCCKSCAKKLTADPTAAMARLDQAYITAQAADYPVTTCLVKGKALGDNPRQVLYGNTLVQFCCGNCVKAFDADPRPTLKALADARASARSPGRDAAPARDAAPEREQEPAREGGAGERGGRGGRGG